MRTDKLVSHITEKNALDSLRTTMESYAPISDDTWLALTPSCTFRSIKKHESLYQAGVKPRSFSFVAAGLCRAFITDSKGNEYNKNFFDEGSFPGSMVALLTASPSQFSVVALEPTALVEIDFDGYRKLMREKDDLKLFQIYYLERNWLIAKDSREVEIVQEDATQRYQRFLKEKPALSVRLPQHHIASHLGITPTQLSRIRKKL